ncbi:MAG: MFS transporter, partial [Pseudobdellovibrionaceae bacterium]
RLSAVEYAFAGVFFMAAFSRLASVLVLRKHPYVEGWLSFRSQPRFRLRDSLVDMLRGQKQRKFFAFLFLFNIAVYISGPFVTPFLLAQLHLTYDKYMWALAALLTSKVMVMPLVNRSIEKFGVSRTFAFSALALSPMPAAWVWLDSYYQVLILQAMSGAAWAGFEVSLMVIFFKNLRLEQKTQILTAYNLFNATAIIIGGLIGAKLLKLNGPNIVGYGVVFMSAAGLRLLCLWPFIRHLHKMPRTAPLVLQSWGIQEMGVGSSVSNPGAVSVPEPSSPSGTEE